MKIKLIVKKIFDFLFTLGPCIFLIIWGIVLLCAIFGQFETPSYFGTFAIWNVIGFVLFVLIAPLIKGNEYFEYLLIQALIAFIVVLIILVFGIVIGAIWPSIPIPWKLR